MRLRAGNRRCQGSGTKTVRLSVCVSPPALAALLLSDHSYYSCFLLLVHQPAWPPSSCSSPWGYGALRLPRHQGVNEPQALDLFIQILQRDADWSGSWVRQPISCGQTVKGSCGTNRAGLGVGWEEEEEEEAKLEGKAGEAGKLRPALLQGPLYLSPLARALRSHGPT